MQRTPWLILPALLSALALSACSTGGAESIEQHFDRVILEQSSLIEQHITDPQKRERLLAQVDRLEGVLTSLALDLRAQSDSMDALMRDHSATEAQFNAVSERFNAQQDSALAEIREIRNACRRLATKEEWAKLTRRQYKILGY